MQNDLEREQQSNAPNSNETSNEETLNQEISNQAAEIERLNSELAQAKSKADEYLDGWQRERAAFANFRRRVDMEKSNLTQQAQGDLICHLLSVLDDLERAVQNAPADISDHPWVGGVRLVLRKFEQVLAQIGVQPIKAKDCSFDPNLHEAITHETMPGYNDGEIIEELSRGFTLGDRVLRCSRVRVAKKQDDSSD